MRSPNEFTPRKILFMCDIFGGAHGGTEGQMVALAKNLPTGWSGALWVLQSSDYLKTHAYPCPWRSMNMPSAKSPSYPRWLREEAKRMVDEGFDAIHAFHSDTCTVAPMLGRLAKIPVITSRRDQGYWQTPRILTVLRRANRAATKIISNSEAVAKRTIDLEQAMPSQLVVIGNGHDPARFDAVADPSLRERLNIAPNARIVGLVANYRPLKRQRDLVEAIAKLGEGYEDVVALFIGTGNGMHTLMAQARALGLTDRIRTHGVTGDVIPVVKHFDAGVLCSESEGLSNAIIEYMACGLPVVCTNVGGNPELIETGTNGVLYEPGDIDALAAGIKTVLGKESTRDAMGAASRARYEERYTLRRMVRETISVYEDTIAEDATPPTFDVTWHEITSVDALRELEAPWRLLAQDGQFFVGPTWVTTWLRWSESTPSIWVAHDRKGTLRGVMPLCRGRRGTLRFCGQDLGADHLDVVGANDERLGLAFSWLKHMKSASRWRRMQLTHVPEDSALRHALRRHRGTIPYGERRVTVCPFIDTTTTWEAFLLSKFSRKRRHELRRTLRRFEEREDAHVKIIGDAADAVNEVDTLFELHRQRFAAQDKDTVFEGEHLLEFHRALVAALANHGELFMATLMAEGAPLACYYGFRDPKKIYHFQSGIAQVSGGTSPGTILRALVLRDYVFDKGLNEFDFLDGDEAYKFQWATDVRRLFDLTIARSDRRGRAGVVLGGVKAIAKDEVKRMLGRS